MKAPDTIYLPKEDAYLVLAAEAEESKTGEPDPELTRDARLLAGERADAGTLILTRAKLFAARRGLKVRAPKLYTGVVTALLVFLAYVAGTLVDRFAGSGGVVNLLAPPLLALLAWQVALYALIVLFSLAKLVGVEPRLPGREALAKLYSLAWRLLPLQAPAKAALRNNWLALLRPELALEAARALHAAAAALGLGLVTSLLVRGIGTAYRVGWESTWFTSDPETVRRLLGVLYGWLPGLPPLPDAAGIAALNFSANPGGAADPALWAMRYVVLVLCVIVLPRLLLTLACGVALARKRRRYPISLTVEPRRTILRQASGAARNALIVWADGTEKSRREDFEAQLIASGLVDCAHSVTSDVWTQSAPEATELEPMLALLVFDLASTPEVEVHGRYLEAAKARFGAKRLTLLLNPASLAARFGENDERLRARAALWTTFAGEYGLRTLTLSLASPEACRDAARRLEQALK